jgi:hypothetical protein
MIVLLGPGMVCASRSRKKGRLVPASRNEDDRLGFHSAGVVHLAGGEIRQLTGQAVADTPNCQHDYTTFCGFWKIKLTNIETLYIAAFFVQ